MMKIKLTLLATCTVVYSMGVSDSFAAILAAWNFNLLSITTASAPGRGGAPTTIAASSGTGTVGLDGWGGLVDDFAGSTVNQIGSDPAEESLSLVSGVASGGLFPGNGTFMTISFSMLGYEDLVVTYAHRGTTTGFNSGGWSWSTDGVTFTALSGGPIPTTSEAFTLATASFAAVTGVDNNNTVTLRYTLSGATSNSGNNRIDNLQISATAIPEPDPVVLLGALGTLVLVRRRNR